MPLRADPSQVFGFAIVLAVLAFYGVVVVLRRRRFRVLGAQLGATWLSKGRFDPGVVVGHDFTIEARARGGGGRSTYRTSVRVSAPSTPGSCLLQAGFFENFPNWKYALTPGERRERAFGLTVSFPQYSAADPEERRALLEWLCRGGTPDARAVHRTLKQLRIRELWIDSGSITVSVPGAVSSFDRLHRTLVLLRGLAESRPCR